jgi:hypothetical protein
MNIEEMWNYSPKEKKKKLLGALGYKKQWAKLSYNELGQRGGGLIQRDLTRLNNKRLGK